MQAAAKELATLSRADAARILGLKSPQAVTMRLRRARLRERGNACKRLRRPSAGRLIIVDAGDLDLLALRN